jgi:1,4-dihydroxy-2-naphthoyl-CoA hydrolase
MTTPAVPPGAPENFGSGFDSLLGLRIEEITPTRVVGRLRIEPRHLQPYGIVHGGVYAAVAETVASMGAHVNGLQYDPGNGAVGLENHTTFLRAAGEGTEVVAEATPLHAGRRTQAWQVSMRDAATGRDLAASRVRLMILKPDSI